MTFKCKCCGGTEYITKPQISSTTQVGLYCKTCGKWQKWLGKTERHLYLPQSKEQKRPIENPCIYCGAELPEGMQVCKACHERLTSRTAEAKSLRWVCNQIPDALGNSNEEKMLKCIKNYCKCGADKIGELVIENEAIRQHSVAHEAMQLLIAEEVKAAVSNVVSHLQYAPWNIVGAIEKMTSEEYADKLENELQAILKDYNIEENDNNLYETNNDDCPF